MFESLFCAAELRRSFGSRVAVDLCDVEVPACGLVGLVGPNGAGKTTLIRLLTGLLRPTFAKSFRVMGDDPSMGGARFRKQIGLVLDASQVWDGMTALENLRYARMLYGLPYVSRAALQDLARVGLRDRADDLASTFSTGMKQRLNIARALASHPKMLILDEPTSGLDPVSAHGVHDVLHELVDAETQILVSSHNIKEIEDHCGHVMMMESGRCTFSGSPGEVKALYGGRVFVVDVPGGRLEEVERAVPGAFSSRHVLRRAGSDWELVVFDEGLFRQLASLGLDFASRKASLEDVFMLLAGPEE